MACLSFRQMEPVHSSEMEEMAKKQRIIVFGSGGDSLITTFLLAKEPLFKEKFEIFLIYSGDKEGKCIKNLEKEV